MITRIADAQPRYGPALVAVVVTAWLVACAYVDAPTPVSTPTPRATVSVLADIPATSTRSWPDPLPGHAKIVARSTPRPPVTVTPWPASVPIPVTVTLDDLKSEVLSWALPRQSPRVERAFYARTDDLEAAVRPHGGGLQTFGGDGWTLLYPNGRFEGVGDVVAIVDGVETGLDLGLEPRSYRGNPYCFPFGQGEVTHFLAFFDYKGSHRGVVVRDSDTEWLWAVADELEVINPLIQVLPSTTPEPYNEGRSPSPTPSRPEARSAETVWLGEAEIPHALFDTALQMPLVDGAWWQYRETSASAGVVWSERVFTTTVTGVRRIAPDEVGVETTVTGMQRIFPDDVGMETPTWSVDRFTEVLVPGAKIAISQESWMASDGSAAEPNLISETRQWLMTPDPPGDASETCCRGNPPSELMRVPPVPGTMHSSLGSTEPELVSVRTPAGLFNGCSVVDQVTNAANSSSRFWCPGIGYVRWVDPGCSSGGSYGGVTVTQLEAWHIPRIVTVP